MLSLCFVVVGTWFSKRKLFCSSSNFLLPHFAAILCQLQSVYNPLDFFLKKTGSILAPQVTQASVLLLLLFLFFSPGFFGKYLESPLLPTSSPFTDVNIKSDRFPRLFAWRQKSCLPLLPFYYCMAMGLLLLSFFFLHESKQRWLLDQWNPGWSQTRCV